MKNEGPEIDALTHRLAECPPDFLDTPIRGNSGAIDVGAIVCDHLRQTNLDNVAPIADSIRRFSPRRQQLIAVTTWLLSDDWFSTRPGLGTATCKLLISDEIGELSEMVRSETMITDPDRREELARVCLRGLGLRPAGESDVEATDRLSSLDSVERERVVRKTRAAEARARQIREKMAEEAAQEAAARYSRE